ncbi:MAG: lytic transglycosylase domain-containing protein [Planctomycetota bacterium]
MRILLLSLFLVLLAPLLAGTPVKSSSRPVIRPINQPDINAIIKAMCLVETDNRAHLRGRSGERGIMQMMRSEWEFATHTLMGVSKKNQLLDGVDYSWTSAYNRDKAIRVGTIYMRHLITKYGDWQTAVKVYHSGHRGVFKLKRGDKYLNMVLRTMETGDTVWRKAKKRNYEL